LKHHIITDPRTADRLMRVVTLEAADVRDNRRHIMNERPISAREQQAVREEADEAT
jgi:hypothetical protein